MIYILGFKKVFLILVFIALSLLMVGYNYLFLKPQTEALTRNISTMKSDVSTKRGQIDTLVVNHDRFIEQRERFDFIEQVGFFNTQDRLDVRRTLNEIREKSGVISAKYSMKPLVVEASNEAKEVNHKLIKTIIDFELGAFEDIEIYNFVFLLMNGFPGIVEIEQFEISKSQDVTQPLLRSIGGGKAEVIVSAKMSVVWRTLVPSDAVEASAPSLDGGY